MMLNKELEINFLKIGEYKMTAQEKIILFEKLNQFLEELNNALLRALSKTFLQVKE